MAGSVSLVSVSVRMVTAAAALLALGIALGSCGDTEEDVAPGTAATASPAPTDPASPTPLPATATTAPVPSGWTNYTDAALGLTLSYPPDLVFKDVTGPSGGDGLNQRVVEFRSSSEPSRGLAISASANAKGLTPEEWVLQFGSCMPKSIERTTTAGKNAVRCETGEGPEVAVVFESAGMIYLVTAVMPPSEFDLVLTSLRL